MQEEKLDRSTVYSSRVRAGRRTYFMDVKQTKTGDFYIIITEDRKVNRPDGTFYFERSKIFLYKEDFDKFNEALQMAEDHVEKLLPDFDFGKFSSNYEIEVQHSTLETGEKPADWQL